MNLCTKYSGKREENYRSVVRKRWQVLDLRGLEHEHVHVRLEKTGGRSLANTIKVHETEDFMLGVLVEDFHT